MKKLKSTVSMLLALVLVLGMLYVPHASAEELSTDVVSTDQILYQESAAEEISNETEDETIQSLETPSSETEVRESVHDQHTGAEDTSVGAPQEDQSTPLSTRAISEGRYVNTANIWPMNGEVLTYTYQGKKHTMDHMPLHAIYYNGAYRTAYCIEPGKLVDGSNIYGGEEVTGESPWDKFDYSKQRGVSLALLYGAPNSINSTDERTDIAYQMATYMIVHEIILGSVSLSIPLPERTMITSMYLAAAQHPTKRRWASHPTGIPKLIGCLFVERILPTPTTTSVKSWPSMTLYPASLVASRARHLLMNLSIREMVLIPLP